MPLLSEKGRRQFLESLSPIPQEYLNTKEPEPLDVFKAAYNYVIDEERSDSMLYNNQIYFDRIEQVRNIGLKGDVDLTPYTKPSGVFDYNAFATDTGLIKTDLELFEERQQLFKERREANQQVMDRGGGFYQFLGMSAAYMTDPINLLTLGFGGVGMTAKGLSVLGRTLVGARNSAAVALASEAAIQPLVYTHKQTIGSPYEVENALTAIATVTIGAGILGGGAEGIAGYLSKTSAQASPFVGEQIRKPFKYTPKEMEGQFLIVPTQKNIEAFKADLIKTEKAKLLGKTEGITSGQVKKLKGELKNLEFDLQKADKPPVKVVAKKGESARVAKQRVIREEKRQIQDRIDIVKKELARADTAKLARSQLSKLEQGILPESAQKELDNFIMQPTTPEIQSVLFLEKMGNNLKAQKGFRAEEIALKEYVNVFNKAPKIKDKSKLITKVANTAKTKLAEELKNTDPKDLTKIENIKSVQDVLDTTDTKILEQNFNKLFKQNVRKDAEILKNNEDVAKEVNQLVFTPEDFSKPAKTKAPEAKTTAMEREILEALDELENFNEEMVAFNRLDKKQLLEGEGQDLKLVDAQKQIDEIDKELEDLQSIMRCSLE
jgi:hypothetical protein